MSRASAGFTLLEMLVAMAILALLLTLATAGLRFTGLAREKAVQAVERTANLGMAQDLLRRQASAAVRLLQEVPGGSSSPFRGDNAAATWLVAEAGYLGPPNLALVSFRVEELRSDRRRLRFTREPWRGATIATGAGPRDDLVLLESGDALAFDYFGIVPGERQPRWVSPWPDRQAPPRLIRLRKLRGDGEADWPALIVALPVEAEAGCLAARAEPAAGQVGGRADAPASAAARASAAPATAPATAPEGPPGSRSR